MKQILMGWLTKNRVTAPVLQSEHIFASNKEICIEHNGERYLLRITHNDNLVLIK